MCVVYGTTAHGRPQTGATVGTGKCKVFNYNILVRTKVTRIVAIAHVSWARNIPKCVCGRGGGGFAPNPVLGELTAHHRPPSMI